MRAPSCWSRWRGARWAARTAPRTPTLGYDYALSKRTVLYARWLQLGNAANASAAIANVPVAANSGDGMRSLALGVRHNF